MTEELDENEVEFYKSVLADLIPWNDKNYDKKLDEMVIQLMKQIGRECQNRGFGRRCVDDVF